MKAQIERPQQFVGEEILWNGIMQEQRTRHFYLAPTQLSEPSNSTWKTAFKNCSESGSIQSQSDFIRYRGDAATDLRTGISNPGQESPRQTRAPARLKGTRPVNPPSQNISPSFWARFLPQALLGHMLLVPVGITEMRLTRVKPRVQVTKACGQFYLL